MIKFANTGVYFQLPVLGQEFQIQSRCLIIIMDLWKTFGKLDYLLRYDSRYRPSPREQRSHMLVYGEPALMKFQTPPVLSKVLLVSIALLNHNAFARGSADRPKSLSRARIQLLCEEKEDGLMSPQTNLWKEDDTDPVIDLPPGLKLPKNLILQHPHDETSSGVSNEWQRARGSITKTGTTIVGVRTANAVVLAADTRATEGSLVADTTCQKLQCTSND